MNARARGFTLIEMVVAIVIAAIVVGFMAMFMLAPVNSYVAQQRRTDLVDSANNAMRMIQSDVRTALPDSVRAITVGANRTVEMLYAEGARYSAGAGAADLSTGDTQFCAIGSFANTAPNTYNAPNLFLVVGHNVSGGNAYNPVGVRTSAGTGITVANATALCPVDQQIDLTLPFVFPQDSPARRVYFVKGPVSYVCNLATGTVQRFEGYSIAANQALRATAAQLLANGAMSSLVARDVTACTFTPSPEPAGSIYGGLLMVRMTFARNGDTFQAFDQIQVENLK
jgi:MSHA biogenesis protein MshO